MEVNIGSSMEPTCWSVSRPSFHDTAVTTSMEEADSLSSCNQYHQLVASSVEGSGILVLPRKREELPWKHSLPWKLVVRRSVEGLRYFHGSTKPSMKSPSFHGSGWQRTKPTSKYRKFHESNFHGSVRQIWTCRRSSVHESCRQGLPWKLRRNSFHGKSIPPSCSLRGRQRGELLWTREQTLQRASVEFVCAFPAAMEVIESQWTSMGNLSCGFHGMTACRAASCNGSLSFGFHGSIPSYFSFIEVIDEF